MEQQKIEDAEALGEAREKAKSEAKLQEEKINLVKKTLAIKKLIEKIIEFTDLTKEEIEKLI